MNFLHYEVFVDLLNYLGYAGDDLFQKEKLLGDAWAEVGGSESKGITKKAFIIFVNVLNNVFLPWMGEDKKDFHVNSDQEVQALHNKFFAFWEHRSKIRVGRSSHL